MIFSTRFFSGDLPNFRKFGFGTSIGKNFPNAKNSPIFFIQLHSVRLRIETCLERVYPFLLIVFHFLKELQTIFSRGNQVRMRVNLLPIWQYSARRLKCSKGLGPVSMLPERMLPKKRSMQF